MTFICVKTRYLLVTSIGSDKVPAAALKHVGPSITFSLVGNWTPRAPPGQSKDTYFFRLIIMSIKQILMLTGSTNVPWGSFGDHLGFRHTRIAKVNKFHNF